MIRIIFSAPRWLRMLLSLLYLGLIALLSLLPPKDLPELQPFAAFDKVVHACMYFGFTMLASWTIHAEEKRIRILLIVLFAICWGLLMEFSQLRMMTGRAFEWTDELANGLGALLGAGVYAWITGVHRNKTKMTGTNGCRDFQSRTLQQKTCRQETGHWEDGRMCVGKMGTGKT